MRRFGCERSILKIVPAPTYRSNYIYFLQIAWHLFESSNLKLIFITANIQFIFFSYLFLKTINLNVKLKFFSEKFGKYFPKHLWCFFSIFIFGFLLKFQVQVQCLMRNKLIGDLFWNKKNTIWKEQRTATVVWNIKTSPRLPFILPAKSNGFTEDYGYLRTTFFSSFQLGKYLFILSIFFCFLLIRFYRNGLHWKQQFFLKLNHDFHRKTNCSKTIFNEKFQFYVIRINIELYCPYNIQISFGFYVHSILW